MKLKAIFFLYLFTIASVLFAQIESFKIILEPIDIPGLSGVQSFAFGQHEGKWLIIGGRLDGLHRRQPFASFSENGNNKQLIVIDPVNLKQWHAPFTSLSIDLQDQLSATNMQFHQQGKYLYILGGYGFSQMHGDHTTYGKLTAVDVPNTIHAIINATSISSFFRQISDSNFSVTGGHLKKIKDTYFLVGGQKFTGRYNPMGPDHGPGFKQQYTDQLRKFTIADDGINISIRDYTSVTDILAFHRRDNNIVPQILPNGNEGLTLFSGVFQVKENIPFLNSVTIDSSSYAIDHVFAQYYNHYHSAVLPLYSKKENEMHTIFFGGIAQYYDSLGVLVQNSDVPFVKTISNVIRDKNGRMAEYKLSIAMPSFSGAGASFILLPAMHRYANEVIKLDEIETGTTLLGHIYGGISSNGANIFWTNTGKESKASSQIFKVFLKRDGGASRGILNSQSINGLQMQVFPNANSGTLTINFYLKNNTSIDLLITDANGNILKKEILKGLKIGENSIYKNIKTLKAGHTYWVTINSGEIKATQKIYIEP